MVTNNNIARISESIMTIREKRKKYEQIYINVIISPYKPCWAVFPKSCAVSDTNKLI